MAAKTIIALFISFLTSSTVAAADTLTVAFVGDVMLDRGVRERIRYSRADALFSTGVDSLFATADRVVANLECPATEIVAPVFKRFVFRAEPSWLPVLRRHGITHLNLANNHSIDQGRMGLMSTIAHIRAAGMTPFGADSTLAAANQPLLLASSPRRVYVLASVQMVLENFAFLPAKPTVSQQSIDSLCTRIRQLKASDPDCCVIVNLHWGLEHRTKPAMQQKTDAHRLVDAGADAVVGHHTHTLQTVETYRGHPVWYSLGNFIFDPKKPVNRRGAVALLHITRESVSAETIETEISNCVPFVFF